MRPTAHKLQLASVTTLTMLTVAVLICLVMNVTRPRVKQFSTSKQISPSILVQLTPRTSSADIKLNKPILFDQRVSKSKPVELTVQSKILKNQNPSIALLKPARYEGDWQYPGLGYAFDIRGSRGFATTSAYSEIEEGDLVLEIEVHSYRSFKGRHLMYQPVRKGNSRFEWKDIQGRYSPEGILEISMIPESEPNQQSAPANRTWLALRPNFKDPIVKNPAADRKLSSLSPKTDRPKPTKIFPKIKLQSLNTKLDHTTITTPKVKLPRLPEDQFTKIHKKNKLPSLKKIDTFDGSWFNPWENFGIQIRDRVCLGTFQKDRVVPENEQECAFTISADFPNQFNNTPMFHGEIKNGFGSLETSEKVEGTLQNPQFLELQIVAKYLSLCPLEWWQNAKGVQDDLIGTIWTGQFIHSHARLNVSLIFQKRRNKTLVGTSMIIIDDEAHGSPFQAVRSDDGETLILDFRRYFAERTAVYSRFYLLRLDSDQGIGIGKRGGALNLSKSPRVASENLQ